MTSGPFADLGLTEKNDNRPSTGGCGDGCGCGHGAAASTASSATSSASGVTSTLNVAGMTCGHCVSAVTEELAEIPGVSGVDVSLDPNGVSTVVVTSDAPLDRAHVAAAIEEAGYTLVPAPLSAE